MHYLISVGGELKIVAFQDLPVNPRSYTLVDSGLLHGVQETHDELLSIKRAARVALNEEKVKGNGLDMYGTVRDY